MLLAHLNKSYFCLHVDNMAKTLHVLALGNFPVHPNVQFYPEYVTEYVTWFGMLSDWGFLNAEQYYKLVLNIGQ